MRDRLVPTVPTEEMTEAALGVIRAAREAGYDFPTDDELMGQIINAIYLAMISAVPTPTTEFNKWLLKYRVRDPLIRGQQPRARGSALLQAWEAGRVAEREGRGR